MIRAAMIRTIVCLLVCFSLSSCIEVSPSPLAPGEQVTLSNEVVTLNIDLVGLRYGFAHSDGTSILDPHPISGLLAGDADNLSPIISAALVGKSATQAEFAAETQSGVGLRVTMRLDGGKAHFQAHSISQEKIAIAFRTAGARHGFGLADHAIAWQQLNPLGKLADDEKAISGVGSGYRFLSTDITGFENDNFTSSSGYITRKVSNFVIYPKRGVALVNIDPEAKIVRTTYEEILQGSRHTNSLDDMYYFFGTPKEIYQHFLDVRNQSGYPVMQPKYAFFGVGWEAWGALAWNTSQATVLADVQRYLDEGHPLSWMVIGSGFWPHTDKKYEVTTSFGLWDSELYPDPQVLKETFRAQGLRILLGLRISFTVDGPYSKEGLEKGYFLTENGEAKIYEFYDFPRSPIYLLDTQNPEAVAWYVGLAEKWGVDGYKEDLYSYEGYDFRDDKINKVNQALMEAGFYIMQRNSYLASAGELHRIDDFNYDQNQDRGPINSLTYAYSGFPLTYMDIIGGKFGGSEIDELKTPRIKQYMKRNATIAALHSAMSMGKGPWHFQDEQVETTVLKAAQLHARLHPYFYSQAVRFSKDGFPWTMVPLPLAYPQDDSVYGRENDRIRGYQWMIGDALLAYPLYGEDYETAKHRDVYLPQGKWIDYGSGEVFQGPQLLDNFPIPTDKTPLFVGGTGIVVEQISDETVARIYPIADHAQTIVHTKDSAIATVISIDQPDWNDWSNVTVTDTTSGQQVEARPVRHALQFRLESGHSYSVR